MKTTRLFLFAFAAFCASLELFALERVMDFRSRFGAVSLVVRYEAGRDDWAKWVCDKTVQYVNAVESWLGEALPAPRSLIVEGAKEVWRTEGVSTPKRIGGGNDGRKISVEYDNSRIGEPWLLFHELAHYWWGARGEGDDPSGFWFIEGAASFLAKAMADAGALALSPGELESITNAWGLPYYESLAWDYPLMYDRRFEPGRAGEPEGMSYSIYYGKSYKAVYLIESIVGVGRFRDVMAMACRDRVFNAGNDAIVKLLSEGAPGTDWRRTLSGWVFEGPYAGFPYADFSDADSDGILGIIERQIGTNPGNADSDGDGLPDGYEWRTAGMNKSSRDPPSVVEAAMRKDGPWADGLPVEWNVLPFASLRERTGDGLGCDFTECRLALRGGYLHVLVLVDGTPPRGEGVFADLMFDTDGDGNPDLEFAAYSSRIDLPWVYRAEAGSSARDPALDIGILSCIEFAVPAALVSGSFSMLPVLRDGNSGKNLEEWDYWITADTRVLAAWNARGFPGDLERADRDRDGIPDGEELRIGLDPDKADPPTTVAERGPFVDGSSLDWKAAEKRAGMYVLADKAGDAKENDIVAFRWTVRGGYLYVYAEFAARPVARGDLMFDVMVDLDGDGAADREFAFRLDNPHWPWRYDDKTAVSEMGFGIRAALGSDSDPSKYGAAGYGAAGYGAEMAIPLALFGSGANPRLLPIVYDLAKRVTLDSLDTGWFFMQP